jgi:hypothetical protein
MKEGRLAAMSNPIAGWFQKAALRSSRFDPVPFHPATAKI